MTKREDITGQKFNYLTAIRFVEYNEKSHNCMWLFKCECGKEIIINKSNVKNGHTKSCGCYNQKVASERLKTHGQTDTKEYRTWGNMKKRCLNPNDKNYKKYGGRGITVCKNWEDSFENFFEDMGYAPSPKHTIDRIDNNGIYEATNCRWATQKEQNRNYSRNINITINDKTHCLKEWCEIYNKPYDLVYQRITKLGWNPATAIRL